MRHRQDSITVSNAIAKKIDTPSLLPIHRARRQAASAFVVVFNPLD